MGRADHRPGLALTGLDGRRADPGDARPYPWAERTFAAIVCTWEAAVGVAHADVEAVRGRIAALCRAGVHVAIVGDSPVESVDARLRVRPGGPGSLHLLIVGSGLYACTTDGLQNIAAGASDLAGLVRLMTTVLWDLGIGSGLVLVAGDALVSLVDPTGGDPRSRVPELARATVVRASARHAASTARGAAASTLIRVSDEQLRRRAAGRVPDVDRDPGWLLALSTPAHPADLGVQETLYTLADGRFGTRGSLEEAHECGSAHVVAAGMYTDTGGRRTLLTAPDWTTVDGPVGSGGRRLLDLRTGVLWREAADGTRSVRFSSCARPGVMGMRVEAPSARLDAGAPLRPCETITSHGSCISTSRSSRGGGISAAALQIRRDDASAATLERLAGYVADPGRPPPGEAARRLLAAAATQGFDALLAEQRATWAGRWRDALVTIPGDAGSQLAVRFALFHLLSSVADTGEAAIGARGLSGQAYDGHVFWDSDVFVLPVLAATRPQAALAMLRYRLARLDTARRRARRLGFAGALWPWESTDDGEDVTPTSTRDRHGTVIPIRTGDAEHHIVADVAWAASHYAAWSGDDAFLRGAGLPLVIEGARFWASRVRHDDDGRAHIGGVIGPDEYHELVDDNAFTNVMARWNLRRAGDLAARHNAAAPHEIARWRAIADALVDGYDPHTGGYEQFAGFSDLTPLIISEIAEPPVAADLLLGRHVVQTSQVVKQADVLMLHHLVPDELEPDSLRPDLDRYAPRTAHGSSLSPAIYAAAWARAGEPDRALDLFRLAARLDLDDLTGTTAAGLHVATFGGTWQALAHGFLGLRALPTALAVDPVLPASWDAVHMTVRFRGARVALQASHDELRVASDRPLRVQLIGDRTLPVGPAGRDLVVALDDAAAPS